MKLNLGKISSLMLLAVFCFVLLPINSNAAVNPNDYIIEELQAKDVPNDDGGGLVLSWKPLPKEKRIIEYRVYRGVTADSLFYIGKVDVNVRTGVAGNEVFFYDTSYNSFLSLESPAKLKKEKQQEKDSPLYGTFPRDLSITGPQLKNFNILAVINEDAFYFKNKKVEITNDDGGTDVYAGLELRHFFGLYKKLLADKEYYYTVFAVTESRKYMPYAEPVIGIARENSPEKIDKFFATYVNDANRLQFEWSRAAFADDNTDHSIYLIKKNDLAKFETYVAEQKQLEKNMLDRMTDKTVAEFVPTIKENPAKLIFKRYCGYPYNPVNTASVNIEDGKIVGENIDAQIDVENIENYGFVFSLQDRAGYETFSSIAYSDIISLSDLPSLPEYWEINDRPDDKGDYNRIYWEKPVAFLTNTSFLNEDKTEIMVNYDFFSNSKYKNIKTIYFDLYDEDGNKLDSVNEYYQDKKLVFNLPEPKEKLFMKITIRTKVDDDENYTFDQELVFDEQSKSLMPGELMLDGEKLNDYAYSIYKNNFSSQEWRLSKKMMGSQREFFDNISYNMPHYKGVSKFDAEKGLLYVDPSFSIRMNADKSASVSSNLYQSEMDKAVEKYSKEVANYTEKIATAETEAEKAGFQSAMDYYQGQIDIIKNNEILKKAAEFDNDKARVKFLKKVKEIGNRAFEYKMVRSDGKAHFSESSTYSSEMATKLPYTEEIRAFYPGLGTTYFFPIPNWFSSDKLPALIATLIFGLLVFIMILQAKRGKNLYVRPIAGIEEIDNAIGRATEMGKPILFVPGLSGISDVATLAGLSILGRVAKKAAEYDTRILVPVRDFIVLPIAQEIVKEAHFEAGRPDTHDKNSVFFITTSQFAFVAGVNGVMVREKTATNFYMGMFWAEALIMTENGSATGAIQIAGTDAVTQIPFFITTCDYTLIGEELYAASAYLAKEPLQIGTLKAVDYTKFLILAFIVVGSILSTVHATFLINAFPEK